MNTFLPEIISEMNRQRIIDEMEAIRAEAEVTADSNWIRNSLFLIGERMVLIGNKLRLRYSISTADSSRVHHLKHTALNLKHRS